MKANPMLKRLPTLLTLVNLLLGLAVVFAQGGRGPVYLPRACSLIVTAALLDAADGALARRLGVESDLGKQLDSFADLISFGLAPVLITLTHDGVRAAGWPSYAALGLYVLAGAFRLARYNLGDFREFFVGLPITAAGTILVLINALAHYTELLEQSWAAAVLNCLVVLLAGLMASKVRIKRFL